MSNEPKLSNREPTDPLIGNTVANYEFVELIGAGGWSRVYKARTSEGDGNNFYAIKVLHSHLLFDKESLGRFEREAHSGVSLSHPNICRVFDYDRLDSGQPFIIMEYLQGESLSSILKRRGPLPEEDAIPLFIACLQGLQEAHAKGIIHRDVKPANIFVLDHCKDDDERLGSHGSKDDAEGLGSNRSSKLTDGSSKLAAAPVKLLDFGMAKIIVGTQPDLTLTGTAFGTVQYMSPEQVLGKQIDGRSDLYSLGCVMYETLTGKKVFESATAFGVMEQHVRAQARPFKEANPAVSVSPALEAIVMRALAKDVDERFQSAEELTLALRASALGHGRLEALQPGTGTSSKGFQWHPHFNWILIIAILALTVVSLFSAIGPLK